MDKKVCMPLFSIIDWIIDTSDLLRAEYFRGYRRGIEALVFGISDDRTDVHYMLIGHTVYCSNDPFIDSYARGYRDGFEEMAPESRSFYSQPLRSLHIASIV